MSFFTLNGFLFYFYRSIALRVWLWLFFASGLLLWGLAVDGNHIGASGIIYGLAAFLFTSGIVRDDRLLLRVSLAVVFLYGGIVWWMLPIDDHVSWEGHLSGAIVGVALAVAAADAAAPQGGALESSAKGGAERARAAPPAAAAVVPRAAGEECVGAWAGEQALASLDLLPPLFWAKASLVTGPMRAVSMRSAEVWASSQALSSILVIITGSV